MEKEKNTREKKKKARAHYRQLRRDIPPKIREEQSRRVCAIIKDFLLEQLRERASVSGEALRVCAYLAVGSELNLNDLLNDEDFIIKANRKIVFYVPKTLRSEEGYLYLQFAPYSPSLLENTRLQTDSLFGIPEPESADLQPELLPDIILLPGLAFELNGKRLGQGGGCYDRYLAELAEKGKQALTILVAYSQQLASSSLPSDEHDCKVDYLAFDNQLIKTFSDSCTEDKVNGKA